MPKRLIPCLLAACAIGMAAPVAPRAATTTVALKPLGSYRESTTTLGVCRRNIAEIVAYDPFTRRLYVTNSADNALDIFDFRRPDKGPVLLRRVTMASLPGVGDLMPTSVAVRFGLVAVAAEAVSPIAGPGKLLLLDLGGRLLTRHEVGSGPDMVTFSPDGQFVLAAVEGEPDPENLADPAGGVAILDLRHGIRHARLRTADFTRFDGREEALRADGVRITPGVRAGLDLEPEFIAIAPDSRTAYVTLQENNAAAAVDLRRARVTGLLPLGLKNHGAAGAGLDASRDDGAINIAAWPLFGAYQPDGIAMLRASGRDFLVTANEGDARSGDGDIVEVASLDLDPSAFPDAAALKTRAQLGRLEVSNLPQDLRPDGTGAATRLVAFGGRSFSIWDATGRLVFDSGDQFERITAAATPGLFNTQDDDNVFDRRSPKRGPEPEGVTVGRVLGRSYAFVGLERHSRIMVYDVTEPSAPLFQGYFNTRDFAQDPNQVGAAELDNTVINCAAGDLGPEGLLFIPAALSPNFRHLLVVAYETSGSIRAFAIRLRRS